LIRARSATELTLVFILLVLSPLSTVAAAHAQSSEITTTWLNQEIPTWQAREPYPLMFSAQFTSASYDNLNPYDQAALEANLNVLYASGAKMIRIDVGYDAWLDSNQTRIGELTNLVQNITSSGRQFVLADAGANNYFSNPVPWSQFQADWIQRVTTLAALFKPSYYIVIKEPGWYVPMVSDATTNPDFQNASSWVALAAELTTAVKSVSPTTQVGVSIAADVPSSEVQFYTSFLAGVEANPQISFIGFDIYNIPGFTDASTYLSQYGSGGKQVWIAEAWSGTGSVAYDLSRSSLDTLWMQGIYYYAFTINAQVINPFFTDIFSSYQRAPNGSQALIAYFAGRTPVFGEYQAVEALNAQLGASSTTSITSSTSTISSSSSTTSIASSSSTTSTSSTTSSVSSVSSTTTHSQTSSSVEVTTASTSQSTTRPNSDSTTIAIVAIVLVAVAIVVVFAVLRRRPSGI
jgi:hypothetical protein